MFAFSDIFEDTVNPVDLSFCIEMGSRVKDAQMSVPSFRQRRKSLFRTDPFSLSLQ